MYTPEHYTIAISLLPKLLGCIYLCALVPFLFQIRALIGSEGILPVADHLNQLKTYLGKRYYLRVPTLFWIHWSDTALMSVVIAGIVLATLLVFGAPPALILPLLYLLYLSIINVGQDFLSFGWELFLMEITVNTFLLTFSESPNPIAWVSINLLLFRFHFEGGIVKLLSKDRNWLNLTGVCFHYESQPLPNTLAWYAHKLPRWFNKLSCFLMLAIEIVIVFGILGTDTIRFGTFLSLVGLQLMIWLTGNFSYLNHMTAVLCVILVSNSYFPAFFSVPSFEPASLPVNLLISIASLFLIILQTLKLIHHFVPSASLEILERYLYRYFIANRYGIFAVMTTTRYEIVIEGSEDGVVWKEYTFRYKPSEIHRRPRRISPYQPRIDWQAWFLPFSSFSREPWFQSFLICLLQNNARVLRLLRDNPFPDKPPLYIRALAYDYTFSDAATKRATGAWWQRRLVQSYTPILSLKHSLNAS